MNSHPIRVMVVDDSPLIRQILIEAIDQADDVEVCETACDGEEALQKLPTAKPDLVTLDVQMPRMNGLDTLERILADDPLPVIMVSSQTQRSAETTLEALQRGAMDYIPKPETSVTNDPSWTENLIRKIRCMAGVDVRRILEIRKAKARRQAVTSQEPETTSTDSQEVPVGYRRSAVAIGISTGGPPALTRLLENLTPPMPAIVIVQHMPAQFTGPFANRLNLGSALQIKEAATGDLLRANQVLIAPGGRHLEIRTGPRGNFARVFDADPVSGHRPSIDVMMQSMVQCYHGRLIGLIMTGMGHDGAEGCRFIKEAGGYTMGQDQDSSDVYGMNKVAFERGYLERQFTLAELPGLLTQLCQDRFNPMKMANSR